ncbi:MAG: hypothetical protein JW712_00105 [Dehalococcoidales bacterium]|nr:hypothetical protein [Dehalococcoidales bacterium]
MELPNTNLTIRELQQYIKSKDFKPGMEHGYFLKLIEEVGELAEVIGKNNIRTDDTIKGTIDEELYDVLYYVLALANLYDIDMEKAALLKEAVNIRRKDH